MHTVIKIKYDKGTLQVVEYPHSKRRYPMRVLGIEKDTDLAIIERKCENAEDIQIIINSLQHMGWELPSYYKLPRLDDDMLTWYRLNASLLNHYCAFSCEQVLLDTFEDIAEFAYVYSTSHYDPVSSHRSKQIAKYIFKWMDANTEYKIKYVFVDGMNFSRTWFKAQANA